MGTLLNLEVDKNEIIHRLQRNMDCLNKMKLSFKSYKFEPKNYDDFKELLRLKGQLQITERNHAGLLDLCKHSKQDLEVLHEKTISSISDFIELEGDIKKYLQRR